MALKPKAYVECHHCEVAWSHLPEGFHIEIRYPNGITGGVCIGCQGEISAARLAAGEVYGTVEYQAAGTELAYAQRERDEGDAYHYERPAGQPET